MTLLDHEELPEVILDFAQVSDFVDYGVAGRPHRLNTEVA